MKKLIVGSLMSIVLSLSLNAAVYATVDGEEVTDKDIAGLMRAMPNVNFNQMSPEQKSQVINQAIERKLLAKKAIADGIEKDEEFQKMLAGVKSDLALEVWMKRVFDEVTVNDKEIQEYYNTNKDQFMKPATVKARHILVKDAKDAQDIIDQLKALKGDALKDKFIELAKEKSTGPSGKNGGDLGWFSARQMVKPFADAAFALEKGAITMAPVKTQFGNHVILTEDKKGGEQANFDETKMQIQNALKMEKFRAAVSKEADALKAKANIVIK